MEQGRTFSETQSHEPSYQTGPSNHTATACVLKRPALSSFERSPVLPSSDCSRCKSNTADQLWDGMCKMRSLLAVNLINLVLLETLNGLISSLNYQPIGG